MKTRTLVCMIVAGISVSASAQNEVVPEESLDTRLFSIETRLARIEELLLSMAPAGNVLAKPQDEKLLVTILGKVEKPGVYPVDPGTPIATLIGLAKGYSKFANPRKISVVRKDGEKLVIDAKKDPAAYELKQGDIVTVPESFF